MGAIAGGIVAGLAVVTIIVAILFFLRRRHAKQYNDPEKFQTTAPYVSPRASGTGSNRIEPFVFPASQRQVTRQNEVSPTGYIREPLTEKAKLAMAARNTAAPTNHSRYPSSVEPPSTEASLPPALASSLGVQSAPSSTAPTSVSGASIVSSVPSALVPGKRERPLPQLPRSSVIQGSSSKVTQPIQEEDAGITVERGDGPAGVSLPPAYNPDWDQERR